ncbi:MAG: hypothetical protein LUC33_07085, partial [Prevotellaceae bacterium]|nr:hypothetical protein [Prevotellaceae bacterium]
CGLRIGGEDYTVKMVVGVKNGKKYYDHSLTGIEKGKLLDLIGGAAGARGFIAATENSAPYASSGYKDTRLYNILQENHSKFVDDNGEPKVFYHNTDGSFTEFDPSRNGAHNDAGWLGDGFYFYGDENEGWGYGSKQMPVFLDVKNPYYATQEDNERLAEANSREASVEFREQLESEGYDGVYYNGDLRQEAVVFKPEQIKSVDNEGSFSRGTGDIRFREGERDEKKDPLIGMRFTDPKDGAKIEITGVDEYGEGDSGMRYKETDPDKVGEATDKAIAESARKLAKSLGAEVETASSPEEVTDPEARRAIEQGRSISGWYDTKTGRVVIYMPNVKGEADAMRTVLHEVVGHKGLRGLIGKEQYDTAMGNLYKRLPKAARDAVDAMKDENGWSVEKAMDEYLATRAENSRKPSWWSSVVSAVRSLLRSAGFNVDLTDADIDYMLWRSRGRLEGGKGSLLDRAADVALRARADREWETRQEMETRLREDENAEDERYERELDTFAKGGGIREIHFGKPSPELRASGLNGTELFMKTGTLIDHMHKHNLTVDDLRGLTKALRKPLLVYEWGTEYPSQVVITSIPHGEGRMTVAVKLERNGKRLEVNEIASVHSKDASRFISDMVNAKGEGLKGALRWVGDKKEALDWLGFGPPKGPSSRTKEELSVAKVIEDFENPKLSGEKMRSEGEKSSETPKSGGETGGVRFREDDGEERRQIDERAKKEGTYGKAPNGKSSKLPPRLWTMVRTEAFKNWFGDWEKPFRMERLRRSEPVEITGKEYEGKYELNHSSARQWIASNLKGEYVNSDTGDVITLDKKAVGKLPSHREEDKAHYQSIAAIPDLIQNAVFVDELPNKKGNGKFYSYRYYVCGLRIGGEDYTVKMVVGVKNGKKYYDHSLTGIEKGKLLDLIGGAAGARGFIAATENSAPYASSGYKDTRLYNILQENHSKFVDDNGEPKVFYHNTDGSFTEFDPSRNGAHNDAGWLGDGFYFYGDENEGWGYGSKQMPVFLDVKNPYYAT